MFKYAVFPQGIAMATMRFRFDGQPINETDTPISLEMEEGDTIEVYQQQTGGRQPFIAC
jgi:small ubiquitin-related modifier